MAVRKQNLYSVDYKDGFARGVYADEDRLNPARVPSHSEVVRDMGEWYRGYRDGRARRRRYPR
jgi:hypothetical protein